MYIPFYHRVGHGLYFGEEKLYWAVLRRTGRTVGVREVVSQTIPSGSSAAAALKELVDRLDGEPEVVATHLDPTHVRCFVAERPDSAPEVRWMKDTARNYLPSGVSLDDFVVRCRVLQRDDTRTKPGQPDEYVLALARREAIEERKEICRTADLAPIAIGDLRMDLCFGFAFDTSFVEAQSPVVLRHGANAWLLRHRNGTLREAPHELGTAGGVLENAMVHLTEKGSAEGRVGLRIVGPDASEAVERVGNETFTPITPQLGSPTFGGEASEASVRDDERANLRAEAAPAIACAVKGLYVRADPINFLDADAVQGAQDQRDRRDVLRAGAVAGGAVAILLFVATVLNLYFQRQVTRSSIRLEQMDERITQVEQARESRDRLRNRLKQSRALVERRTRAAAIMDAVGQAVPQGIWFDELNISRVEDDSIRVRASGYATRDADVATLLSQLEERPQLQEVGLEYSRIVPAESVYERTGRYREALTRFAVFLVQSP